MRSVLMRREGPKYLTLFIEDGKIAWDVTSYTWLPSAEQTVAWIEDGKHPIFRYV